MQKINKITPRDISDLFQITLGISDHTQLKRYDNNVASLDATGKDSLDFLHATNKQNGSTFPIEIWNLLSWRTLGMPEQTQQTLHDLTKVSLDI